MDAYQRQLAEAIAALEGSDAPICDTQCVHPEDQKSRRIGGGSLSAVTSHALCCPPDLKTTARAPCFNTKLFTK